MAEDRYANWAGISAIESAANTLTFQEKLTGVGFGTGKGMLIDQIDYFITQASMTLLLATGDGINFGITSSTGITDLEDIADSRVVHTGQVFLHMRATVGMGEFEWMPHVYQFFPSIIIAHQRIFLAVEGVSLASAATIRARVYWRFVDLTDRNIAELVQATLLQG